MAEKRGWSKMGLKERVLNKLALIEAEIERGAYSEEDLLFMEKVELSGKIYKIFRNWDRQGVELGYDPSSPEDFLDEIRRKLIEEL
jgi:hypothetical protein